MKKLLIILIVLFTPMWRVLAYETLPEANVNNETDRFVVFYLLEVDIFNKFRLDTQNGELIEIKLNKGDYTKTQVIKFTGIDTTPNSSNRNGRFKIVLLGGGTGEFLMYDADSGRVWQSKRNEHRLNEIKFD